MFHEYNGVPECFEDMWKKIRTQNSQLRIPRAIWGVTKGDRFLCKRNHDSPLRKE